MDGQQATESTLLACTYYIASPSEFIDATYHLHLPHRNHDGLIPVEEVASLFQHFAEEERENKPKHLNSGQFVGIDILFLTFCVGSIILYLGAAHACFATKTTVRRCSLT